MFYIALKMLMGDKAKFIGLLLGIAFTAFLVTFASSYFAGFMTRGFALINENNSTDVWVMDPAVDSVELTTNMSASVLQRVRSVEGVRAAMPLLLGDVDVRFPNGSFQMLQVVGVDDVSLTGAPALADGTPAAVLHAPDAVIVDPGGTSGKLRTPVRKADQWPFDGPHLEAPVRDLTSGDELLINGHRVVVAGRSNTLSRFPPRPLLYTTYTNALRILPPESNALTFVLVSRQTDVSAAALASRIQQRTGMRARTAADFKKDTVRWYLANSEDVGDMTAMLILAMTVGFGVTGVMLYMFTYENLRQYALIKAVGAADRLLLSMIFVQAGVGALLGSGIGVGVCALVGEVVVLLDFPFRMMWFTPLAGLMGVSIVCLTAAVISIQPVLRLEPGMVFEGR